MDQKTTVQWCPAEWGPGHWRDEGVLVEPTDRPDDN